MLVSGGECPDDVGLSLVDHLFPIGEEEVLGYARPGFGGLRNLIGPLGALQQLRQRLGDANQFGIVSFQHVAQVQPDVRMQHAHYGDFVFLRGNRQGHQ